MNEIEINNVIPAEIDTSQDVRILTRAVKSMLKCESTESDPKSTSRLRLGCDVIKKKFIKIRDRRSLTEHHECTVFTQ